MNEEDIEKIKNIIRDVEAVPGTKVSSFKKSQEMMYGYEAIRDIIFTPLEVERMKHDTI